MILISNPKIDRQPSKPAGLYHLPFKVVADDREGRAGWSFDGINAGSRYGNKDYAVDVKYQRLLTGDYTIENHRGELLDDFCAIERKSFEDLCGSICGSKDDPQRRERFAEEHERMSAINERGGIACVIIEGSPDMLPTTNIAHRAILNTWLSWESNYDVPWIWAGSRSIAEYVAIRKMTKCWRRWIKNKTAGVVSKMDSL